MSKVIGPYERAKLALLVGKMVLFKAHNLRGATWQKAFLRTLHLTRDGDWMTLKYSGGEWTGPADGWIIKPMRKP